MVLPPQQWCSAVNLEFYKMATKASVVVAPVVAGKTAPAPAPVVVATPAPMAPLFSMGGWPVKAQGGNTVRAYCYQVAKALTKAQPQGFTIAQFASAMAAAQAGSTMRQPGSGWGTAAKPNGAAMQHANWFAHSKQGWLAPVAPAPAPATKA